MHCNVDSNSPAACQQRVQGAADGSLSSSIVSFFSSFADNFEYDTTFAWLNEIVLLHLLSIVLLQFN